METLQGYDAPMTEQPDDMQWETAAGVSGNTAKRRICTAMCVSPSAAFAVYVGLCDEFITQAKNDRSYDGDHMPKSNSSTDGFSSHISSSGHTHGGGDGKF